MWALFIVQNIYTALDFPDPHCQWTCFIFRLIVFCWLFLQETLGKLSPVAYVDILEGDTEGYVRFNSPEEARVVSDARAELQKEHSWKLEILSGETSLYLKVVED